MTKKGQGSTLQIMLAILLVALLTFFLYINQSGNATENIEQLGSSYVSFENNLQLQSIFLTDYIIYNDDDMPIVRSLSYGCSYGDPANEYRIELSEPKGILLNPPAYIKQYWRQRLTYPYRFVLDCDITDPDSPTITVGNSTPSSGQIIATQVMTPLPPANMTRAYLYQWQ